MTTKVRPTTEAGLHGTTYGPKCPKYPCQSERSPYCIKESPGTYSDGVFGYKGTVVSDLAKLRHEKYNEPLRHSVAMCGACFNWECWNQIAERDRGVDAARAVVVNGTHYYLGDENERGPSRFRGFGGNRFVIRFLDGRTVTSTNLWHQGEVPQEFAEQLPDNAEFVREQLVEMERAPKVNEALGNVRKAIGLREFDGKHCINCGEEYSDKNMFTAAGWSEAKISGFCEKCFDENA